MMHVVVIIISVIKPNGFNY